MILARENLIITPDEMKGIMKHQSLEANTFVPQIFFGMTVKLYACASYLNRHENCAKLILEVTERLNAHTKQISADGLPSEMDGVVLFDLKDMIMKVFDFHVLIC